MKKGKEDTENKKVRTIHLSGTTHTRMDWSSLPEAITLPSAELARQVTAAVWPLNCVTSSPVTSSHSLRVPLSVPTRISCPSVNKHLCTSRQKQVNHNVQTDMKVIKK